MPEQTESFIVAVLYVVFFIFLSVLLIPLSGFLFAPLFGGKSIIAGYIAGPVISLLFSHLIILWLRSLHHKG